MLLSCFRVLVKLVVNTEPVYSNSDCKYFLFFDKSTGSRCTLVSGTTVFDSRDLLLASAEKSVARLWHPDCA